MIGLNYLHTLLKIPLKKGTKQPVFRGWNNKENQLLTIDINKYDVGIITGINNNIFILDVDIKDDGIEEIDKYIKEFGEIDTLTIKTPSGGKHYYFKYDTTNILLSSFKNKIKLRNKGLDIRTTGGYVKAPPSPNYTIIKDILINNIDDNLLLWLMVNNEIKPVEKQPNNNKTRQNNKIKTSLYNQYKYNLSETEIINIFKQTPNEYLTNFYKWCLVLSAFKNLSFNSDIDIYKLFDKWSKGDTKGYNEENNLKLWKDNNGQIEFNLFINHLNKITNANIKAIPKYKLNNTNLKIDGYKTHIINSNYLNFDDELIINNDTIIINSTTGTGKTTKTAQTLYNLTKDDPNIKVLSIVNLISLSHQQGETFKDFKIKLLNYQEADQTEIFENNIVICLNSLYNKLESITDEEINNLIVYIDEINSFIESLLFNDDIKNLKLTYIVLMRIIKYCKKIIVSDARINQNIINLLQQRNKPNKIFIKNEFKKYKDIEAIKHLDENEYLENIEKHIKDDNYFLFGSDSKNKAEEYYNKMIYSYPDKKEKFLLITSKTNNKNLFNVKELFKNKFVFYSPSITTGLDFSIDTKQDVFLYINGKTIYPENSFQQATRTRNINKLFYYSNSTEKEPKYNSLEELETVLKLKKETHNKIINLCLNINSNDEEEIVNNTFFKLYSLGLYKQDTEQTNKLLNFENILKKEGFKLSVVGTTQTQIKKEVKNEIKKMTKQEEEQFYNNYLKYISDPEYIYLSKPEFKILEIRQQDLKIYTEELEIPIYKSLLLSQFEINSFYSISLLFKTDKFLKNKYEVNKTLNFDEKILTDIISKITLIRQFETELNIKTLDINFNKSNPDIKKLTDDLFLNINKYFTGTKTKPQTTDELKKCYVGYIRNILGNTKLIKNERATENYKKTNNYYFDTDILNSHFKLYFRQYQTNFLYEVLSQYNIIEPPNKK